MLRRADKRNRSAENCNRLRESLLLRELKCNSPTSEQLNDVFGQVLVNYFLSYLMATISWGNVRPCWCLFVYRIDGVWCEARTHWLIDDCREASESWPVKKVHTGRWVYCVLAKGRIVSGIDERSSGYSFAVNCSSVRHLCLLEFS